MKQNAEISATHDYYEFVFFDRMRRSTTKYDELRSTWRNRVRSVGPHVKLALRKHGTLLAAPEPLRECGCNRRTARVATAYCRHDRDRVSVTVPDVTS